MADSPAPTAIFPDDERLRFMLEGRLDYLVHFVLPREERDAALSEFKAMSGGFAQSVKSDSVITFYPRVSDYKNDARPTAVALRADLAISLGVAKDDGHSFREQLLKGFRRWSKKYDISILQA